MSEIHEGGCYCKAFRYKFTAKPSRKVQCFCRDCQYFYGGGSQTLVTIDESSFELSGKTSQFELKANSGNTVTKYFCKSCFTPVYSKVTEIPGEVFIQVGTLDNPSRFAPKASLWTKSAPDWACINDDLPKFY